MKYASRLSKLEHTKLPVLSLEEQGRRLSAFVECETMVRGERPSGGEIEAERERLARPIRKPTPNEMAQIAEEIKRILNERP